MIFLIQTVMIFSALYFLPWLGDPEEQGRSVILLVISVVSSTALLFIWDLVRAPVTLHRQSQEHLEALKKIVLENQRHELICDELATLHKRGKELYFEYSDFPEWKEKMELWSDEVSRFIAEHFMLNSKYRFLYPISAGGEYSTDWSWDGVDHTEAFQTRKLYTSRLIGLRDVVVNAPGDLSLTKLGANELLK